MEETVKVNHMEYEKGTNATTIDMLIENISNELEHMRDVRLDIRNSTDKIVGYDPVEVCDDDNLMKEPQSVVEKFQSILTTIRHENSGLDTISQHLNKHI